jgi:MOSC domain-containing protein
MQELGRIVRLQVQRFPLKTGEKPHRVYSPAGILAVERLLVGPDGAFGLARDGSWVVDVHHRLHPTTRNEDGGHGVSLGFTAHYGLMQTHFGARVELGCAGENILVETTDRVGSEDLGDEVALRTAGGEEIARLQVLQVAHPCRPFTGWAFGGLVETDDLREGLQFLDDGMRGYYCRGVGSGVVSVGDRVVLLER